MNDRLPAQFSARPYMVVDMPMQPGFHVLHPEQAVLRFGNQSEDIGALCYAHRSPAPRRGTATLPGCRHVALASLRPERAEPICRVIEYLSALATSDGKGIRTLTDHARTFKHFMDWADANGHPYCLQGGEPTLAAFRAYASGVEEKFRRHEFENHHAAKLQRWVRQCLESVTGQPDLGRGVRFIPLKNRSEPGTDPVPEYDFAHTLGLCSALFHGLSPLALEAAPYPYRMPMPKSLGWSDAYLWVFPVTRWCLPPHLQGDARARLDNPYWHIDYPRGQLANPEEIWRYFAYESQRGQPKSNGLRGAIRTLKNCAAGIEKANGDARNFHRLKAASNAHNAFLLLFMAQTGLNFAVVRNLEWHGDIIPGATQQGFREIKWRAGGKEVSAIVRTQFMPHLKRFVRLRDYLLGGQEYGYLFLSLGSGLNQPPHQINEGIFRCFHDLLRNIDPRLRKIGPRKLRATTHDWFNRHVDPALAARIHGHALETAERAYQAGSPVTHREELGSFLEKVSATAAQLNRVVPKDRDFPGGKAGPLGTCSEPNAPLGVDGALPIAPDCTSQDGCLFCKKHHIKADEEDARKLASCAYVIQQTTYLPGIEAHFRPVLDVIDALMAEIRAAQGEAGMVDRIIEDVFSNGNLDPYWAGKLSLLDNLEILP